MRRRRALLAVLALSGLAVNAVPAPAASEQESIAEVPVSFQVTNTNPVTSTCSADGGSSIVRGSLVGPEAELRDTALDAATLYIHGSGDGSSWHFPEVASNGVKVDHITEMAKLGHVSVFIHTLGYGLSDAADGNGICFGSVADMTHQVVQHLRHGTYETTL
jgi:hypothetical protein